MLRSRYARLTWAPVVGIVLSAAVTATASAAPPVPPDDTEYSDFDYYAGTNDDMVLDDVQLDQTMPEDFGCEYELTECDPCESMCDCWSPIFTMRAEAIIWDRVDGGSVPLVSSPVNLTSADFDFPFRAGPRITLTGHEVFCTCWDVEAVYFGIDGWQSELNLTDIDNYLTSPTINIGGTTPGSIVYTSTLDSFELNLRREYEWLTWLAGFRMIQVSENQNLDIGGLASHQVDVMNQLYGGQTGADLLLYDRGGALYSNLIGKVGVYSNNADSQITTAGIGGALPLINAEGSSTSFAGELSLLTGYRLTERLHVIGGYNLLWITELALAPDQFAVANIATGDAAVDTSRSLFYHGANVGLQYSW